MAINFLEGVTTPTITATTLTVSGGTLAVTGPLTDTQLRATALPISGTVAISGTVPVSFTQTGLTDTQLRATAVPVSLASVPSHAVTLASTTVTNTVAVSGPLTDTQLRATAVPVSGTVAISGTVNTSGPLTDTQLRASAVPVSLAATVTTSDNHTTAAAPISVRLSDGTNFYNDPGSRSSRFTQATTITSSTAATTVVTAPGAGLFADLTNITITNSNTTTATLVTLSDGTVPVIYSIPAGGGIQISLNAARKATTVNTAWTLTCGTSVASIYCVIDYVKTA